MGEFTKGAVLLFLQALDGASNKSIAIGVCFHFIP